MIKSSGFRKRVSNPTLPAEASCHLREHRSRRCVHRFDVTYELKDIEAPFAVFDLGDEGLRHTQTFGQLRLGKARALASLPQKRSKAQIIFVGNGLAHDQRQTGGAPDMLILISVYPKTGYSRQTMPMCVPEHGHVAKAGWRGVE